MQLLGNRLVIDAHADPDTPFTVLVMIHELNEQVCALYVPLHEDAPAIQDTVTDEETAGSVKETSEGAFAETAI
jgi:hypothetical protein